MCDTVPGGVFIQSFQPVFTPSELAADNSKPLLPAARVPTRGQVRTDAGRVVGTAWDGRGTVCSERVE